MKLSNLGLVLSIFVVLLLPPVLAVEGQMPLLAVKETDEGYVGSNADLFLEIKRGEGRVFLDTFPLTKLDTQMSTRFAREIACDYLDINCNKYDFIYTIESNSAIVGGPSAGAAETLLAISLLSDFKIDEKTSITGTINSGGLIGSVGGLKEKIDAGARIGLKRILIPKGRRFIEEEEKIPIVNDTVGLTFSYKNTIDLVNYGMNLGVEVIEVADIDDAIAVLTGSTREESNNVTIDPSYSEVMKGLAIDLCSRTKEFETLLIDVIDLTINDELIGTEVSAKNLTIKGKHSLKGGSYYSAASYCFGANVKYNYIILAFQDFTKDELKIKIEKMLNGINKLDESINKKEINTMTDLESYMVVKERLIDAKDNLNQSVNESEDYDLYDVAYGIERLYSAYSWYEFFGKPGKEFDFNKKIIEKSCKDKLSEAEERFQYVRLYLPNYDNTKKEINHAYSNLQEGNYELCLFKAAKAKAEANYILNLLGVQEDQLDVLIDTKLAIIRKNIAKGIQEGIFPILGYSYLEYANNLKESDKLSSLLYLEYALELSNLNIYFEEKDDVFTIQLDKKIMMTFFSGAVAGFIIGYVSKRKKPKKKRKKK